MLPNWQHTASRCGEQNCVSWLEMQHVAPAGQLALLHVMAGLHVVVDTQLSSLAHDTSHVSAES
jgi:hypothetical protein